MKSQRVLIADDARTIRLRLKEILEDEGFQQGRIHMASDGREAVEAYREHSPDIVFLDLEMPHMTGEKVAERILEQNPKATVVLMTGFDLEDPRMQEARSLGAFGLMRKPLREENVQEILRDLEGESGRLGRV